MEKEPEAQEQPDITSYTLRHITVTDDLGVEYSFNGIIHMDLIVIEGEINAFAQMKRIN